MSNEAVTKVAFLGKAPRDPHDLRRILDIANRLIARHPVPPAPEPEPLPRNVIRFPVPRSGRGGIDSENSAE